MVHQGAHVNVWLIVYFELWKHIIDEALSNLIKLRHLATLSYSLHFLDNEMKIDLNGYVLLSIFSPHHNEMLPLVNAAYCFTVIPGQSSTTDV